jgi:hypothetical protein
VARALSDSTHEEVLRFLNACDGSIVVMIQQLRDFLRTEVPTAVERVYWGWCAIGYRDPQAGYFCGLFPQKDHIRLYFEYGAALPDPSGLLQGDIRQTRYLVLRPGDEIPEAPLRALLRAALLHGSVRR